MGPRRRFEPIGSSEPKKKPSAPLDVQLKRWARHNKMLVAFGVLVAVCLVLMWFFGRSRAASGFASSKGWDFSSSADYKLPKRLSAFEALSRGSKQYAFNSMKGELEEVAGTVQAFDLSYTENKIMSANKRVSRSEKVHELSAMLFSKPGLGISSLLVSPRDMVLEDDFSSPTARADPDVEDVMSNKKDAPTDDDDDDDDDDAENPQVAGPEETAAEEPVAEEPVEEELDVTSHKFNQSFLVETVDIPQTEMVMSPKLKKVLLSTPGFFVDFQGDRFLVYREFTFEPEDYETALQLGKAILDVFSGSQVGASTPGIDLTLPPTVFVSKSKMPDDP